MQIQEAEQGDLGTSGALLVSRIGAEGGDQGLIFVVTLGDLSGRGSRVSVGAFVEQVLAGLRAALDSFTMFRDGTTAAGVETTLLFWLEIAPGTTEREVNRGIGVKAGFITDEVWPVDAGRAGVSGSVDRDIHVTSGSRVVFLGCLF
jgi:hypothetical protein